MRNNLWGEMKSEKKQSRARDVCTSNYKELFICNQDDVEILSTKILLADDFLDFS